MLRTIDGDTFEVIIAGIILGFWFIGVMMGFVFWKMYLEFEKVKEEFKEIKSNE